MTEFGESKSHVLDLNDPKIASLCGNTVMHGRMRDYRRLSVSLFYG